MMLLLNPDFYLVCAAVSTVSLTVTRSTLFKDFRAWTRKHSVFLGRLCNCPYCFSHWLAFPAMWLFPGLSWYGYLVGVFAMVAVSSVISGVISKLLLDSTLEAEISNLLEALEDAST